MYKENEVNEFERTIRITKRAQAYRFDWEEPKDVCEKIAEELEEFRESIDEVELHGKSHLIEEVGDLLFVVLNACRLFQLDPEQTLKQANDKFEARFGLMLSLMERDGYDGEQLPIELMEHYWEEAKRIIRENEVT